MSGPLRVLNLVTNPSVNTAEDFRELADWIAQLDSDVVVHVLEDIVQADVLAGVPDLPTLTVSPAPVRHFRPRRGPLLQGQLLPKSAEYRALEALGIPVPRWARLLPGQRPNLDGFGRFVVTKPDFGARGADVRVERRTTAHWSRPRTNLAEQFGGPFNPRVAQELVYTGPWPSSFRVATLFGTALWSLKIEASHARQPLRDRHSFQGQSVVSSGSGCSFELASDLAILALAERAHQAFPHLPLLGADLVRDAETGQLFVIELNSLGYTWHFSSPSGLRLQREFGLDLNAQLDGRRRAAQVLANVCASQAR
jgi:hypothetical protein